MPSHLTIAPCALFAVLYTMQHNVLNILNIGNGTCLVGQKCVYCLGACLHGFQLQTGCKQQLSVYSLKKSHVHVASNFLKASGICRKVFLCEAACLTQHVNIQKDENQVHWACASWSTRGAACIAMVSLTALASYIAPLFFQSSRPQVPESCQLQHMLYACGPCKATTTGKGPTKNLLQPHAQLVEQWLCFPYTKANSHFANITLVKKS